MRLRKRDRRPASRRSTAPDVEHWSRKRPLRLHRAQPVIVASCGTRPTRPPASEAARSQRRPDEYPSHRTVREVFERVGTEAGAVRVHLRAQRGLVTAMRVPDDRGGLVGERPAVKHDTCEEVKILATARRRPGSERFIEKANAGERASANGKARSCAHLARRVRVKRPITTMGPEIEEARLEARGPGDPRLEIRLSGRLELRGKHQTRHARDTRRTGKAAREPCQPLSVNDDSSSVNATKSLTATDTPRLRARDKPASGSITCRTRSSPSAAT